MSNRVRDSAKGILLIVSPLLPGGTRRYILDLIKEYKKEYIIVFFEYRDAIARISVLYKSFKTPEYEFMHDASYIFLERICQKLPISSIHLNHLIHMDDHLRSFFLNTSKKWIITLHDYYTICPRINMYMAHDFCNNVNPVKCLSCLKSKSYIKDIEKWRSDHREILRHAARIICPSYDMKKRLQSVFDDLQIDVIENPEIYKYSKNAIPKKPYKIEKSTHATKTVGVLGMLDEKKGRESLLSVCRYCLEHKKNYRFVLFGELLPPIRELPVNLQVTGRYKEKAIVDMIRDNVIDFFWFPARWPETYSYTLSIPIRCGIPVIGTNLGAIGERIKKHGWGIVYPHHLSVPDVVKQMDALDVVAIRKYGDFTIHNDKVPAAEDLYGIQTGEIQYQCRLVDVVNCVEAIIRDAAVTHHKKLSFFECFWGYKHLRGAWRYVNFFLLDFQRLFREIKSKSWNDMQAALTSWLIVLKNK